MTRYILKLSILILLSLNYAVSGATAPTNTADEAYAAADYTTAIEQYRQAIEAGIAPTAELYYNLGCAYFKNGDIAPAILAFERAYLIDPADSDTRYNIELANSRTIDKMNEPARFFLSDWMDDISHWFMLNTWLVIGVALFLCVAAAVLLYWFGTSRTMKIVAFYCGIVALVLCIFANTMAYKSYRFTHDTTQAILMSEVITVKSSPDMSAEDIVVVHFGLKVTLLQRLNGFAEVRLPDGTIGWLPETDFEVINIFVDNNTKAYQ